METNRFASGWKRNYYGKGDVIVYRLRRGAGAAGGPCPVFGANVMLLLYGETFWPTYTTGDNTGLVATDSMKNFIQRETLNFDGEHLDEYARFLGEKFLTTYPQAEGAQLTVTEIPYTGVEGAAFTPAGPERRYVRLEMRRAETGLETVEARSGIHGFRLLRLGGSAFYGFVRDQYTTLPDLKDRPLHMWLDVEWTYSDPSHACNSGRVTGAVRKIVRDVFCGFTSGSIQEVIYKMGMKALEEIPEIAQVDMEANNRTWDTAAEQGAELGVYTDARPPFGCLGLSLRR